MTKIIDIIKARRQEAGLIVVFQAGMMVLMSEMDRLALSEQAGLGELSTSGSFMLGVGAMVFMIVTQMLFFGFLKSTVDQPHIPKSPGELVKIGSPCFWRVIFFQLLIYIVVMMVSQGVSMLAYSVVSGGKEPKIEDIPRWLMAVSFFVSAVLFIKPILLVPGEIIVNNRPAMEAFFKLRQYRLIKRPKLLITVGVCVAINLLTSVVGLSVEPESTWYFVVAGVDGLAFGATTFVLYLSVIQYVMDNQPIQGKVA